MQRRPIRNPDLDMDQDETFTRLHRLCVEFTMTSTERMYALYCALGYLERRGIPGDIVECGVWRGGSVMLCALTLLALGNRDRKIYLYDTFEGMTPPSEKDVDVAGRKAEDLLARSPKSDWIWAIASREEVEANLAGTGFPEARLVFVEGDVMKTLPGSSPERIALLRLDTDWYESTMHELTHLYPRLSDSGVLIVDDYGHHRGHRQAIDEYFAREPSILLNRIDYAGRIGIKA